MIIPKVCIVLKNINKNKQNCEVIGHLPMDSGRVPSLTDRFRPTAGPGLAHVTQGLNPNVASGITFVSQYLENIKEIEQTHHISLISDRPNIKYRSTHKS